MSILKPGTAIGKTIASRVKGFPVWEKEPKRKKKLPTCWIRIPTYNVKPPKQVDSGAAGKNYPLSIQIISETREELIKALNHMINCGLKEIEAGDKRFWLHAVQHKIQHKTLFRADLKYIFRIRQIPEEIL